MKTPDAKKSRGRQSRRMARQLEKGGLGKPRHDARHDAQKIRIRAHQNRPLDVGRRAGRIAKFRKLFPHPMETLMARLVNSEGVPKVAANSRLILILNPILTPSRRTAARSTC